MASGKQDHHGRVTPKPTARYTPPINRQAQVSRPWVPILMFTLLGLGAVVIFHNYVAILLPGATDNKYLLLGLVMILGGIVTATQYR
jgi:hypothetical protein